jgi:hypothetical protein
MKTEHDLEGKLLQNYQQCVQVGYRANRAYQLFMAHCRNYKGGIEAVRRVLEKGPSNCFRFVVDHGRPDLLWEHIVLDPEWQHLFSPELQSKAQENLATLSA